MNNYRVNIRSTLFEVDYWNKFDTLRPLLPMIKQVVDQAGLLGIKDIWWFWEPYLEITWLGDPVASDVLFKDIERIVKENLTHYSINFEFLRPESGNFADWFCKNEGERQFGAYRHAICADWCLNYLHYKNDVDNGKGLKEQVKRTIHTLCNPLALNYKDEAYICFSRGLICLLFCFFDHKTAVWIYTKIFRQKY